MPLPRFRLRTLMIAVAVAALVLYGLYLNRLCGQYRAIAADHARREQFAVSTLAGEVPDWALVTGTHFDREQRGQLRRRDCHARLRRKYERAARRPWLPVPPDPPPE